MPTLPNHSELFNRLLLGQLSSEETEELIILLAGDEPHAGMAELVRQHIGQQHDPGKINPEIALALEARLPAILSQTAPLRGSRFSLKTLWIVYMAAATILVVTGTWMLVHDTGSSKPSPQKEAVAPENILPGRQGAVLTLDDGTIIVLDSLGNGVIGNQGGAKVVLRNGQLTYSVQETGTEEVAYNTMSTPKGRQFQLRLPDGTRLWLDASSSIRYPTVFSGKERLVQVTGEVYFEVAPNPAMPFRVMVKDNPVQIEVLGTHFNVNAYANETTINTTLLEGSVKIYNANAEVLIKPGQQAQVAGSGALPGIKIVSDVNLQKVMAWKDGIFDFGEATLEEVMRQLERWYDIEVVYEKGVPPLEFVGKMTRDLSLPDVLHGLEVSEVHFSIEGRKLIVKP